MKHGRWVALHDGHRTRRASQAGFTLIEMMIAIMLMAIISIISWRALDSVTRASARLDSSTEETASILRVLQQFEQDVSLRATMELQPPPQQGSTPQLVDESGQVVQRTLLPQALDAVRQPAVPFRIEIIRTAVDAPGLWQRVYWWRNGGTLYRAAAEPSYRFPLPEPGTQASVAVLQDVSDFDVRAWQPKNGWTRLPMNGPSAPASGLEMTVAQRTAQGEARYRSVVPLQ